MKIIETLRYIKIAKKEWDPNPWAVCHTTVDKNEDPSKFERCVQDVKKDQKEAQFEGLLHTPDTEDDFADRAGIAARKERELDIRGNNRKGKKRRGLSLQERRRALKNINPDMSNRDWQSFVKNKLKEPVLSSYTKDTKPT